jgi:CRP-like cAMP-binding protein
MEALKEYIQSQASISAEDLESIISNFTEQMLPKDSFLLQSGQIASAYYYVQSGALRIYFDTEDKEVTGWIAFENEFFTELASLKNNTPTRFNIQALEDTILLTISKDNMERLYKQYSAWQHFGRQVWETAFLKVLDGILAYQTMTAEDRYRTALQNSDLLQRLPLKDLASYLGITPNSLSRIRKNI